MALAVLQQARGPARVAHVGRHGRLVALGVGIAARERRQSQRFATVWFARHRGDPQYWRHLRVRVAVSRGSARLVGALVLKNSRNLLELLSRPRHDHHLAWQNSHGIFHYGAKSAQTVRRNDCMNGMLD